MKWIVQNKYFASQLIFFSSLRNLGFRNPVQKKKKKSSSWNLFLFLGSHPGKYQLPPTKLLLKVQIKRLILRGSKYLYLFNSDNIKRKFFHCQIFAIFCKKLPPSSPPSVLLKCVTNYTARSGGLISERKLVSFPDMI